MSCNKGKIELYYRQDDGSRLVIYNDGSQSSTFTVLYREAMRDNEGKYHLHALREAANSLKYEKEEIREYEI